MSSTSAEKQRLLAVLPLKPFEFHHISPRDKSQAISYLNLAFASLVGLLDHINAHGRSETYVFMTYKAPSGRKTTDEEALVMFRSLRDEGLFDSGKETELATEMVEDLKVRGLIEP